MKSKILQDDHDALIKLNQSLSSEEKLEAFYRHSQLLSQLYFLGQSKKSKTNES